MGMIGNAPYQGIIQAGNIGDGIISASKLADNAVTTSKVADSALTAAKLAAAAVTDKLGFTPPNLAYVKNIALTGGFNNGAWYPLWYNTDITSTGVYIVDFYVSTQYAGGNLWSWHGVSAPFYYYAGGTNSEITNSIPMHQTGHAGTNTIALRTRTNPNNSGGACVVVEMQYNGATLTGMNSTGGKEGFFYLRRLY